jgi:hypothetical protein
VKVPMSRMYSALFLLKVKRKVVGAYEGGALIKEHDIKMLMTLP